jgi:hypothetical protein
LLQLCDAVVQIVFFALLAMIVVDSDLRDKKKGEEEKERSEGKKEGCAIFCLHCRKLLVHQLMLLFIWL